MMMIRFMHATTRNSKAFRVDRIYWYRYMTMFTRIKRGMRVGGGLR